MNPHAKIERGALYVDGKPTMVWSADYPYYRDQRADWSGQLDNLKRMNVDIVTFYIPWRHHAPTDPLREGGVYDFSGQLHDRTDVLQFIRLIREKGMRCIAKPGPYIHAETRFGSLPDYVLPDNNSRIQTRVDMQGNATPGCWGFERPPAPMDPEYLLYVRGWLEAVAREVIVPNQYPHGPILAVQVLNEGVYSDGGYGVDKFNFETTAAAHYPAFLEAKYGSVEKYNGACGTRFGSFVEIKPPGPWSPGTARASVRPWLDWAEFGQAFYRRILSTYVEYLREEGVSVPAVINLNPPPGARGAGVDTVMGRYNPPDLTGVAAYGYTNWAGVVAQDQNAYLRYKFLARAARGINMEENWGFDSYDPPIYWHVQPSFFQSMMYLLFGSTGLNIYLGVSCDCWTDYLAVDAGGVYMHNHPIAEDGSLRASFWTCHQMGALMRHMGEDLVSRETVEPIAWAFYTPYAQAASWDGPRQDWQRAGFSDRPRAASPGWDTFMALCHERKTQNGLCYPREESLERLLERAILFLDGADWMDADTQRKLVDYVERGGVLVMTSRVPELGEFFEPCTVLRDALFPCPSRIESVEEAFDYQLGSEAFRGSARGAVTVFKEVRGRIKAAAAATLGGKTVTCGITTDYGKGHAVFLGFCPWLSEPDAGRHTGLIEHLARAYAGVRVTAPLVVEPDDPLVDVAQYRSADGGRRFVYLLTRREQPGLYRVRMNEDDGTTSMFEVHLPARSGALIALEGGRIAAALVKGYNDLDRSVAAPWLKTGDEVLAAAEPCDLYFCRRADGLCEVSVANVQSESRCTEVTLPQEAGQIGGIVRVTAEGDEVTTRVRGTERGAVFVAEDMRGADPDDAAEGLWSPWYLVRPCSL